MTVQPCRLELMTPPGSGWTYLMSRQWSMWKSAGNISFSAVGERLIGRPCAVRVEGDRGKVHIFLGTGAQDAWQDELRRRAATTPSLVEDAAAGVLARGAELVGYPLEVGPPARLADAALIEVARSFYDRFLTYTVEHASSFMVVEIVSARFAELVASLAPDGVGATIVAAYSRPSRPAYPQRLAEGLATIPDADERIRYLAREAPWLGNTDPFTPPSDEAELLEMTRAFHVAASLAPTAIELTDAALVRQYQFALYLKDTRNELLNTACFNAWPIMRELAGRLGISASELGEFLPAELGNVDLAAEIARRRDAWVLEYDERGTRVISGPEARAQFVHDRDERVTSDPVTLRGISGSPGRVRGAVQKVSSRDDIRRFEKGRVLVAASTNPSYIMAMARAVALVTDDGGLGSHAAIVAREMSKPCVVGTGTATQLLRDGDVVEVDADRGEVTLIGRA
ncbi:MAG: PEP-utilizing enzyme [Proteobacteria bacterium]|nr:PEP-utilizing enzyme [Pseudomonadota bacterium]